MTPGSCPACGGSIQPGIRLCPYCGARVDASSPDPGELPARSRLTRVGSAALVGFSILVLALAAYIDIVQRDPMALVFGILIVVLLWVIVRVGMPRVRWPPASRPP